MSSLEFLSVFVLHGRKGNIKCLYTMNSHLNYKILFQKWSCLGSCQHILQVTIVGPCQSTLFDELSDNKHIRAIWVTPEESKSSEL